MYFMLIEVLYICEDGVMANFIRQTGQAMTTQKMLSDTLDESMWMFLNTNI